MTCNDISAVPLGRNIPHGARALCRALTNLHAGRLEVYGPAGEHYAFEGVAPGPQAQIDLRRWDAADELLRLHLGHVRAYLEGAWDSTDLPALLTLVELNQELFREPEVGRWWDAIAAAVARGVRINVHTRYRLGNEFYRAWLDPAMAYSAALFDADAKRGLEHAQIAKFEHILQVLRPRPGQRLLDIGCGWGGFAQHAAAQYGCRVDAVCISRRQVQWARERMRAAGLHESVSVELRDFRDLRGRYDFVVSIEAYEAIGQAAWGAYFDAIARCLDRGGTAFVQAGVLGDKVCEAHSNQPDFLRRHVHANAQLASWKTLEWHARQAGLQIISSASFSDDYVRTLQCWRERFNHAWVQLAKLGLDQRFRRLWNFYLAYCEAGYRAGRTKLVQVQLAHH